MQVGAVNNCELTFRNDNAVICAGIRRAVQVFQHKAGLFAFGGDKRHQTGFARPRQTPDNDQFFRALKI
jgi:hypothetical protein